MVIESGTATARAYSLPMQAGGQTRENPASALDLHTGSWPGMRAAPICRRCKGVPKPVAPLRIQDSVLPMCPRFSPNSSSEPASDDLCDALGEAVSLGAEAAWLAPLIERMRDEEPPATPPWFAVWEAAGIARAERERDSRTDLGRVA